MKSINLFDEPSDSLTEDEIIYTLKNKEILTKSIDEKLGIIQKELDRKEDNEMIETASFRSMEITDVSCIGKNKDLTDVIIQYYANRQEKRDEYLKLFGILAARKRRMERIWLCFLTLEEPYYTYIKRLYVDGEKYATVEMESGFSRQVFAKYRKEALQLIIRFYFSDNSMFKSVHNHKKKRKRKVQKTNMEQITMYDFLTENNA